MVSVPFPSFTADGKFSESGGRLVNAYPEKLPDGRTAWKRVPGLRQISTNATHLGCRGMMQINSTLLVARGTRLMQIIKGSGTYFEIDIGALPGDGPVYFARNNKSPTPDIVAVTDSTAYLVSLASSPTAYPDADVGSPNSVTQIGGYFVFSYGDGTMRASGLNDTSIATTDFAKSDSRPDNLYRVIQSGRDILAFSSSSIEVWTNTGEPVGFPLSYRDTIDLGLVSATAVAGYEPEGSGVVVFAASDNSVRLMNGYQPQRISNHYIERLIESVTNKSTLRAHHYVHSGHPVWTLTSPNWTLCYDLSSGAWYQRESYGAANWRAAYSCRVFDSWIFGDATTGQVYAIDETYYREGSNTLVAEVQSATISGFPRRARWLSLDIDIKAGVGSAPGEAPVQTDPQCMVSLSRDGGATFGNVLHRSIGKQGEYTRNVRLTGAELGSVSQKGAQVRVAVSDPVDFTLFGANTTFDARAS